MAQCRACPVANGDRQEAGRGGDTVTACCYRRVRHTERRTLRQALFLLVTITQIIDDCTQIQFLIL